MAGKEKRPKDHVGQIKLTILVIVTLVAACLALASYYYLAYFIGQTIWNQLSISRGSGSFEGWRLNPVPIIDRFYLYNITNYRELSQVIAKPNTNAVVPIVLQEVGPFTYRQVREKKNISFESDNKLVSYDQYKRWFYLPDLTLKSQQLVNNNNNSTMLPFDLQIYHVNLPLAGTTLNTEFAELADPFIQQEQLKLFRQHNVSSLMFDGYKDELMLLATEAGQLDYDHFGWMYNQNDTSSGKMKIYTGVPRNFDNFGQVQEFNKMSQLSVWSNISRAQETSQCNKFSHASAGDMYPPDGASFVRGGESMQQVDPIEAMTAMNENNRLSNDKSIYLFLGDLCRTFELVFNGSVDYNGLLVDRYIANEYTFDYTTLPSDSLPGNHYSKLCYCMDTTDTTSTTTKTASIKQCPPNGMMDLFTCRKGGPLTVSFPYFLYSDHDKTLEAYLKNKIKYADDNKQPSFEEHGFYLDLETTLNVPVRAQVSLQFNVHYRPVKELSFTKNYTNIFRPTSDKEPGHYYIPQMWFQSSVQLDDETHMRLKVLQNYVTKVAPIITSILSLISLCLLIACVAMGISMRLNFLKTASSMKRASKKSPSLEVHNNRYEQLRVDEPMDTIRPSSGVYETTTTPLS